MGAVKDILIENEELRAEVARLRAAIKPVLEVKLVDEGVRCELTTPCAVCDWWISGCEDNCPTLAVFKAAKECQRKGGSFQNGNNHGGFQ